MQFSNFNIFSKIKNSDNWFIVNILSGNADILSEVEAEKINALKNGMFPDDDEVFLNDLVEKGYLTDSFVENKLYKSKYLDFLDARETDEIQLFFVPNYACNFGCHYCYQDEYAPEPQLLTFEIIDSFYHFIESEFTDRNKYITLFGGEPLLGNKKQKELISYFLKKSNEAGLEVCIVTNGYTLADYIEILKTATIREIQVTLDGTKEVHDSRRFLKKGGATFERIASGIDDCLENNLPVNLRMVADKDNINNLPELATYAIEKGWTSHPLFKTQIGRNYELHHCQSSRDKLFTRISLFEKIYELTQLHPQISHFHKPSYSITKFLSENGELPEPLFDSCPACKTEWAFDYTGSVYSCTATVGKADEKLGTFFPHKSLDKVKISEWHNRDVLSVPQCKLCNLQLACGGGCGSVAKNRTGTIASPDCRPVCELMEIGFSAYF